MYYTLLRAGSALFQLVSLLIFVNVIFSWIRPNRDNPIVQIIYNMTEPILEPLRKITLFGPVDFSPILAMILIDFVVEPVYRWILGMIFL